MDKAYMNDPGYRDLADAIILQAVIDYRRSVQRLAGKAKDLRARRLKHDTETFFRSRWFGALTNISGRKLLIRLNQRMHTSEVYE